jgi:NAD(P)-dependent dehydrogenase (short-subunit alcohol dehydrogenase family)
MNLTDVTGLYDFSNKVIAITGGGGVLCGDMARALAGCNADIVVLDRDMGLAENTVKSLKGTKGKHTAIQIDVLDKNKVEEAASSIMKLYGKIDILINGAGGNNPKATTNPDMKFFDIPSDAFQFVSNLNLIGTVLPCQVFGKLMAERKAGIILNISSMNAFRPLTRIPAYSAAKAAVSNFTQWLAVHMAQEYSPNIRVNAIAPGFFLTEQNRFLLTDKESGALTQRGKKIIDHTPASRFGETEDLLGAVLFFLSPISQFVTGVVLPIDGGFSAYSGV